MLREEGTCAVDAVVFREDPTREFWESEGFRYRRDIAHRDLPDDEFF
ncbi:hypothetical protein TALC_00491 [Thermoplasmatales archaeon BRNA1]|nr:hypothetical protein TALC_00491 [Thermoplasmatales archaeon BRNA1]